VIYTLTLNPSIDYIVNVDHFETGKLNRTEKEILFPGGKGINVSIVLKNLGFRSVAYGITAGFTGMEIERLLKEQGIDTDFIRLEHGYSRINLKLRSDCESEINGRGPEISEEEENRLIDKLSVLKDGDIAVLAGAIPGTMKSTVYSEIMERLQKKDVKFTVDATRDLLVNVLKYHPFLIKPNHHELGEILHREIDTKDKAVEGAKELRAMGARNVMVSMAGEGAVLVDENGETYRMDAPKGRVKNSVGAGDSAVAGFLAGYLANGDYGHAFKTGVCAGSASAFSDGFATKEDVERLMREQS
jgi:1-phosphofructokinase